VTGQGERLIRLTMALFYGQTISVRYIIRQFDVSPRTARRDLAQLAFVLESAGPHRWRLAPSLKP
ncbi:TPA: DeoR family transcriptional regulator, partial [Citrobacter freundii]